jgi:ankyrin repeat protein
LLFKGVQSINVNCINDRGDTPLHLASRWGFGRLVDARVHQLVTFFRLVALFLEHGAMSGMRNYRNETPLHCAHNKVSVSLSTMRTVHSRSDHHRVAPV